jgi:hypothetical protein
MKNPLHARIARTRPNPIWQTATMDAHLHLPPINALVAPAPPTSLVERTMPPQPQPRRFRTLLLLLALKRRAAA